LTVHQQGQEPVAELGKLHVLLKVVLNLQEQPVVESLAEIFVI
jgi:hypothetical protein